MTDWPEMPLAGVVTDAIGGLWGKGPDTSADGDVDVMVVRGADFANWDNARAANAAHRRIPERLLARRQLRVGDLVLEVSGGGPSKPVGRTIEIDDRTFDGVTLPLICSNFCRRIRPVDSILPRFLKAQLDLQYLSGKVVEFQNNTTNIRNLQVDEFLRGTSVFLPGMDTQLSVTSHLRRMKELGHATFERVGRLARMSDDAREAILLRACSGGLTSGDRETGRFASPTNPIREIRRRPRNFVHLDSYDLPNLPDDWVWVQVDDVVQDDAGVFDGPFGSNLKTSDYCSDGARVVRLENIGHLEFISSKESYVSAAKYQSLEKHWVYPGDIAFSSFVDRKVRVAVLPASLDDLALAKADCFTIRVKPDIIDARYLAMQLASQRSFSLLAKNVHGDTRPRVNTSQLRSLPVPLCSIEEQVSIVDRYEDLASRLDAISSRLQTASRSLARLERADLYRLFGLRPVLT